MLFSILSRIVSAVSTVLRIVLALSIMLFKVPASLISSAPGAAILRISFSALVASPAVVAVDIAEVALVALSIN